MSTKYRTSLLADFPPVKECFGCSSEWVTDQQECPDCGECLSELEVDESKKLSVWSKNLQRFVYQQLEQEKVSVNDELFQQVYELSSYLSIEGARQEMRASQEPLRLVLNDE